MNVVEVRNLSKTYPGAIGPAVADVSFGLAAGEILAFLGPNGAGKTTTIKMMAGLVLPSAGEIRVSGIDVVRQRDKATRHLGAVLEGARNLYWRLSAEENLRYFGALRGTPRRQLQQRIDDLLQLMDLAAHKGKEVRHFSRGMQQKLAIAAALIHDPDILLLDEPTLGLDVQAASKVEETVRRLAAEQGKSVLLTTHIMPLAENLADRIFVIRAGREVACDHTRNLLNQLNGQREAVEIRLAAAISDTELVQLQRSYQDLMQTTAGDASILVWPQTEQRQVLQLLTELDRRAVKVEGYGRRQATLEEVFLALTNTETS